MSVESWLRSVRRTLAAAEAAVRRPGPHTSEPDRTSRGRGKSEMRLGGRDTNNLGRRHRSDVRSTGDDEVRPSPDRCPRPSWSGQRFRQPAALVFATWQRPDARPGQADHGSTDYVSGDGPVVSALRVPFALDFAHFAAGPWLSWPFRLCGHRTRRTQVESPPMPLPNATTAIKTNSTAMIVALFSSRR